MATPKETPSTIINLTHPTSTGDGNCNRYDSDNVHNFIQEISYSTLES